MEEERSLSLDERRVVPEPNEVVDAIIKFKEELNEQNSLRKLKV